jgi:hypothetical protein
MMLLSRAVGEDGEWVSLACQIEDLMSRILPSRTKTRPKRCSKSMKKAGRWWDCSGKVRGGKPM